MAHYRPIHDRFSAVAGRKSEPRNGVEPDFPGDAKR
jgi:hypothetical protein